MSRLLRALVKHNAVTVVDGRIVPTPKRHRKPQTPKQNAAVYSGQLLLLADAAGAKVYGGGGEQAV